MVVMIIVVAHYLMCQLTSIFQLLNPMQLKIKIVEFEDGTSAEFRFLYGKLPESMTLN